MITSANIKRWSAVIHLSANTCNQSVFTLLTFRHRVFSANVCLFATAASSKYMEKIIFFYNLWKYHSSGHNVDASSWMMVLAGVEFVRYIFLTPINYLPEVDSIQY